MCFSCWPPSLLVRVWLWSPAWCSFMFVPHGSPSSHMLRSKEGYQICVSSLRFGSGLYDEAGFLGGSHMWVCGLESCRCPLLVVSIYVCGVFLCRRSCVSSPPAGGGLGSSCASFGVTAQRFSWGHLRFSATCMQLATLLGFTPS